LAFYGDRDEALNAMSPSSGSRTGVDFYEVAVHTMA
jgi:hypothetical protein